MPPNMGIRLLKEYLDSSTIHGFKYITEPRRNIIERLYWIGCSAFCFFATYKLFLGTWDNFQNNAISFTVDTDDYLQWDTNFPSVTICQRGSEDSVSENMDSIFGPGTSENVNLIEVATQLAFTPLVCKRCQRSCKRMRNGCPTNFTQVAEAIKFPCQRLFKSCSWNSKPFNCCENFLPLNTEYGNCLSMNSKMVQLQTGVESKAKFISNVTTGAGNLEVVLDDFVSVFLHSPLEIPTLNHRGADTFDLESWGRYHELRFRVNEIQNDHDVPAVPIAKRGCRFSNENNLKLFPAYSYSACVTECRINRELELCNCTHHLGPNVDPRTHCDMNGLECLSQKRGLLETLRTDWCPEVNKLVCDCMASCEESSFTIVYSTTLDWRHKNDEIITAAVKMESLPVEKFRRNVVRGKMDLVVSMGGIVGLFLGGSLLSIVELIYYLIVRPFFIGSDTQNTSKDVKPTLVTRKTKVEGKDNSADHFGVRREIYGSRRRSSRRIRMIDNGIQRY